MKIKIHFSFVLYMMALTLIGGISTVWMLCLTLMIHEMGHILVGMMLGQRYEKLELTPLGGIMSCKAGTGSFKGGKGVAIAIAGPVANGIVLLLLSYTEMNGWGLDVREKLFMMNFAMMALNLLPVLPLDGGRIVFAIGYYIFPLTMLLDFLMAIGAVTGVLMISMAGWGWITYGRLNITLAAVGLFVSFSCHQERKTLLAEHLYDVIVERKSKDNRIATTEMIYVPEETALHQVIPYLCQSRRKLCILSGKTRARFIHEELFLEALIRSPHKTISHLLTELKE